MSAAPHDRQPWPMKWVALAILLLIVPYTIVTLRYRKPEPAFQPYEDLRNRANVSRLLSAGYQRIPLVAQRPADTGRAGSGAFVAPAPGGLPAELRTTLVEALVLPTEITHVAAASSTNAAQPYSIQLACTLPNEQQQLGGADLYVRGEEIVLTPKFEPIGGTLLARSRDAAVLLTIPAGTLKPGRYDVTLVGERASRRWSLEVK